MEDNLVPITLTEDLFTTLTPPTSTLMIRGIFWIRLTVIPILVRDQEIFLIVILLAEECIILQTLDVTILGLTILTDPPLGVLVLARRSVHDVWDVPIKRVTRELLTTIVTLCGLCFTYLEESLVAGLALEVTLFTKAVCFPGITESNISVFQVPATTTLIRFSANDLLCPAMYVPVHRYPSSS